MKLITFLLIILSIQVFGQENYVLYQSISDHYTIKGHKINQKTRIAITHDWIQFASNMGNLEYKVSGIFCENQMCKLFVIYDGFTATILANKSNVILIIDFFEKEPILIKFRNREIGNNNFASWIKN